MWRHSQPRCLVHWAQDGAPLADFVTDDRGRFRVTVEVPDVGPGRYEVMAIGESTPAVYDTITVTRAGRPCLRPRSAIAVFSGRARSQLR